MWMTKPTTTGDEVLEAYHDNQILVRFMPRPLSFQIASLRHGIDYRYENTVRCSPSLFLLSAGFINVDVLSASKI